MREQSTLWQLVSLEDDGLVLELRRCTSVVALVQELLRSKAAVSRVFARGQLTRDGQLLAWHDRLEAGEQVRLAFIRTVPEAPVVRQLPTVIFRDPLMLAVDKPAGLLVHGDGSGAPTLTDQVSALLAGEGYPAVPQAVQRLDVETTGVVLFSLTEEFQPTLDALVAGHGMSKRYLAVVEGKLKGSKDAWRVLNKPIARDRHDARKMRVGGSGKPALTRVRTLATRGGRSLLLVELGTGRRHQIRVHLAHAGHPILGDTLYGGRPHQDGLMLHAWLEELSHPVTGARVALQAPYPARFAHLFPELPDSDLWG